MPKAYVLLTKDYEYDDNNYYVNGSSADMVFFALEDAQEALREKTRETIRSANSFRDLQLYGYYYQEEDLREIFPGRDSYDAWDFYFPDGMTDEQIDSVIALIENGRDYYGGGKAARGHLETPFYFIQEVDVGQSTSRVNPNTTEKLVQETPRKIIRTHD